VLAATLSSERDVGLPGLCDYELCDTRRLTLGISTARLIRVFAAEPALHVVA
jgi:hypothetical protein